MTELPDKVLRRFRDIHGDCYDYSEFVYEGYQTKGVILCPIHGPFEKSPEKHINRAQGCKRCSNQAKSDKRRSTTAQFIVKAKAVHGDAFDYAEFVYVDNTTKGRIRCTLHDVVFEQSPAHHLSGHCACEACIQGKSKAMQLERYGAEHHSQTAEFRDKVRETSLQRFGVEHRSKADDFREVMQRSSLERFGVEFASRLPEFQERVRETSRKNHGVDHHLQAADIRSKIVETVQTRYGRANVRQAHVPAATLVILDDRERLVTLLGKTSVKELARDLGISDCTLGRHCYRHGIILPASTYERSIAEFLDQNGIAVRLHDKAIIKPWEIDIVLTGRSIGIEFGGIYYHGEMMIPDPNYHLAKLRAANAAGYRLITIFEDEWLHKRPIVETRLLHILGKSMRGCGARSLIIKPIAAMTAATFLDQHHLQGAGTVGYARYGAHDGDILVAVMTFSRPRVALGRTSGADELLRFATDGRSYPGIASRLFQTYLREHQPDRVISYADRRWSEGDLYARLGFQPAGETAPNYWYTDRRLIIREHRFKYRKDRIKHLVADGDSKTEVAIMRELKRDRIWDCGSLKYEWTG